MNVFIALLLFGSWNGMLPESHPLESLPLGNTNMVNPAGALMAVDTRPLDTKKDPDSLSYGEMKTGIANLRKSLAENFREGTVTMDSIQEKFVENLVDNIIPYWLDTPWSFEGHTAVPKHGKIACGYFISTTLRDMGLRLNRYKLAQKGPLDEAKALSCGEKIYSVVEMDPEKAFSEIDRITKDGIYFIGFDKGHVGYVLKRNSALYLVHSNYLYPALVRIESLKDSRVFQSYTTFHLVAISNNSTLMQRWLDNSTIL
ncbi:hypothetical protein FK220_018770 [Flavobacteriaceae bacterium TP-CH-4]|uniref:Uncharacterized protein n=1 Tax=Pelagihabitans pacificus TaxID=2696054 RepID=A0A967AWX1_9FLAO|nr:hypothetical protein [Pelagihabitans pacificus]NHF61404.1 hypothetical protein [Pelagihabitans pacificus]